MDIQTITGEALLQAVRAKHPFSLALRLHPERAAVFQRYGEPDAVAAVIRESAAAVFYQNQKMCMTEHYLLEKDDPESLLLLKDIQKAYPLKIGDKEYLIAENAAGGKFRYSFAVGQKQLFKITILLDKIHKLVPDANVKEKP